MTNWILGTPGWRHLAEPMLNAIRPPAKKFGDVLDSESIIDLSREHVIVPPDDLAKALYRLQTLLNSHPNPGLCKRLLGRVLLPLWTLSSWPNAGAQTKERYCTPAAELLKVYFKLESSQDVLLVLVQNLNYLGGHDKDKPEWIYQEAADGRPQIIAVRPIGGSRAGIGRLSLEDLNQKASTFLELVGAVASDENLSSIFIELFKKWVASSRKAKPQAILIRETDEDQGDPLVQIMELKVLESMMQKFPDKLASQPVHVLELVSQILAGSGEPEADDEAIPIALSLLNTVITVPGFQKKRVADAVIQPIESALAQLSARADEEISRTARNLGLLLQFRDEIEDLSTISSAPTDRQIEDRKTYKLAISYITQVDSPPPVRSEGLSLISSLIQAQSPILDIPGILVLLSSLLKDDEDYINLRVIKIFSQIATRHPKSVTKELLDHYVDSKELSSVDSRLRFGEALVQVIERLGETFTGDTAQQVGEALLSLASRRGYRPKTLARQAREERAQALRNKQAAEEWGGEMPDLSDPITEEEKMREAILSQIVQGWESKRGAEDVRIRASALSILMTGLETNIAGLGPTLVTTAVDLSMNILQLEPELEKGILRRSAILLVLGFVRALDQARQSGRKLGFGIASQDDIVRVLQYVADTDNDGLVQQHARDVIESLESWDMARLVPEASVPTLDAGLTRLAGLAINPGHGLRPSSMTHPKIEEIE